MHLPPITTFKYIGSVPVQDGRQQNVLSQVIKIPNHKSELESHLNTYNSEIFAGPEIQRCDLVHASNKHETFTKQY